MSERLCHCFGAGDFFGIETRINEGDIIIAADGGLSALESCGLSPDYIIGDFDSLGKIPKEKNTTVLPAVKDTTDMFEAIELGVKNGCNKIHVYGGTGGRLDHTIANIQLLKYFAEKGITLFIHGGGFIITSVTDGEITVSGKKGDYISVFSLSDISEGVTLKDLKYELKNYELTNAFPLGVSNEFTGNTAKISVKNGTLAVYYMTERNGF